MPIELTAPVEGNKLEANETEDRKKTSHCQQQSKRAYLEKDFHS